MEFRVLKYFLAAAKEENISKAAEFLNTTQPNLSRQLRNLEEELGKPLFLRGGRKLTLTEAGVLLKKRAEEMLELYEKTEAELTRAEDELGGDIRIGCGESHAVRLIAKAAKATNESYPNIKFHLFSGDAATVTERLDNGLLDFGVLIDYDDMSRYEYIRLPLKDVWGILMKSDSPLTVKQSVTADDLRGLPLICSRQNLENRHRVLSNWFRQGELTPNVAVTYNLIYNASLMVEEGLGYAVTLDRLIRTDETGALRFRPLSPRLESHLDIAWKKYQVFPRAAEVFLENLRRFL